MEQFELMHERLHGIGVGKYNIEHPLCSTNPHKYTPANHLNPIQSLLTVHSDGNVGPKIIICLAIQPHIRRKCRNERTVNTNLFQGFQPSFYSILVMEILSNTQHGADTLNSQIN